MESKCKTGLILTGGGARAAYQVGVLDAVASLLKVSGCQPDANPFEIICGTSAGAINATAIACHADDFDGGVQKLVNIWQHMTAEQVYRADSLSMMRSGARWLSLLSFGWLLRKWRANPPNALLDNSPLAGLLTRMLDFSRLDKALSNGQLHALAVTASSYTAGHHHTFYQSRAAITPWLRTQRMSQPDFISIPHLLASSAIPFIFPAIPINCAGHTEYCGDGSMRQLAPISPAIHLGAGKVLVVGAGRLTEPARQVMDSAQYPSLAQIAGHAMSSIFLDGLAVDIERLNRINVTLSMLPGEYLRKTPLRPIEILVIAPSLRLDDIAARHVHNLPMPLRTLLSGIGATEARGAALASYLLFESSYTSELIELGRQDTYAMREEVLAFFSTDEAVPARGHASAANF